MNIKILKVAKDQIRFLNESGELVIEPNTPYYQVKILQFNNERIDYTFDKEVTVKETYDDMIFNAEFRGDIAQIRPNFADMLCLAIQKHQETGNLEEFDKVFTANNTVSYNHELIESMFKSYGERIKISDEGFTIDDMFMVDRKGHAWIIDLVTKEKMLCGNGAGRSLCLVVNNIPEQGMDRNTVTVLAKIQFLLQPNHNDRIFMNQLPAEHKKILDDRELECLK